MLGKVKRGYRNFVVFVLVAVMAAAHIVGTAEAAFAAGAAAGPESAMTASGTDDQREDDRKEADYSGLEGGEEESEAVVDAGKVTEESEAVESAGEVAEESEAVENQVPSGAEDQPAAGAESQPESQMVSPPAGQPEESSGDGAEVTQPEAKESRSENNESGTVQEAAAQGEAVQGNSSQAEGPQIATTAVYEGLLDETVIDRIWQISVNVMVELNGDLVSVAQLPVAGEENNGDIVYDFFYRLPEEYAGYANGSVSAASGFDLVYKGGVVSGEGRNLKDGEIYDITVALTAKKMGYGVKHVLKGDEETAIKETAQYGIIGEMTDARPVVLEGYAVAEIRNELLKDAGQIILIVYVPENGAEGSYYTVKYIDKATGDELAEAETRIGLADKQVTVKAKGFAGYAADEISKSVTLKNGVNEIVFLYTRIAGLAYRVVYCRNNGTVIEERNGLPVLGADFAVNADSDVVRAQAGKGYKLEGYACRQFSPDPEKDGSAPENTVTFVFVPERYRIAYEGLEESGWENPNPTEYTVEDEIRLVNPEKEGYVFTGWEMGNGTKIRKESVNAHDGTEVVIEKGTVGHLVFRALWEKEPLLQDEDQREPEKEQQGQPEGNGGDQPREQQGQPEENGGNQSKEQQGQPEESRKEETHPEEEAGAVRMKESSPDGSQAPESVLLGEKPEESPLLRETETAEESQEKAEVSPKAVESALKAVESAAGSGHKEEVKEQKADKVVLSAFDGGNSSGGPAAPGVPQQIGPRGSSGHLIRFFRAAAEWLQGILLLFAVSGALVIARLHFRRIRS